VLESIDLMNQVQKWSKRIEKMSALTELTIECEIPHDDFQTGIEYPPQLKTLTLDHVYWSSKQAHIFHFPTA
jgi:hypothetical protein